MSARQSAKQPPLGGAFVGRAFWVSMGVVLALVVIDQLTKNWAESTLTRGQPREVLGSFVQLRLIYNPGAAFSFLTNATWVFTVLATVAVLVLTWMLSKHHPRVHRVAFVLMLSGAAGNLVDRLTRAPGFGVGHVVDFIELPKWPIFNVADICVTSAAILLVVSVLMPSRFGIDQETPELSERTTDEGTA